MLDSEKAKLQTVAHVHENSSSENEKNSKNRKNENATKTEGEVVENSEIHQTPDNSVTTTTETATQIQFMLFGPARHSTVPKFLFTDKKYSSLEELILDFNCITEIPSQISKLTSLQKFTASFNQLTTLPTELFSLSSLTFLRVSYNQLTKLPNAISALTKLTELHLDTNFISSLPRGLTRLSNSLKDLYLPGNTFISFPKPILALTNLEFLDLSGCHITRLPTAISLMTALKDLSLMNVHLISLPSQITALTKLTSLQLSMNELRSLPPKFENLQLEQLNISYNHFRKFPSCLLKMKTLTYVTTRGNIKRWTIEKLGQSVTFEIYDEPEFPSLIMPGLYLGSLESAKNRHFLKENNVTHILSILNGAKEYYPNDFIYKIIREEDSLSANLLQYFEETFEYIDKARETGGVLVHCASGISRSATITIAYVMKKKQLSYQKAREFVHQARPIICPNLGFEKQLKVYEKQLFRSSCIVS